MKATDDDRLLANVLRRFVNSSSEYASWSDGGCIRGFERWITIDGTIQLDPEELEAIDRAAGYIQPELNI